MSTDDITSIDLLNVALDQEAQARQLLFEGVADRARTDESFRQRLAVEPEKAVREVVESLPSEQRSSVDEKVISDTTEKVQALSKALPGFKEKEVSDLVFTTIEDARCSFNLSLRLTQVLFYAGLVMVVATFITALFVDPAQLPVLIFGGGSGILGVITALLINPIDRVQNAAGNLVQLEIAFLSYYKQLSLLTLPSGHQSSEATIQYAGEVRQAMTETVALIEAYCEYRGGKSPEPEPTTHNAHESD